MLKFSLSWSKGRPKHRLLTELETALDLQRIRNGVQKGEGGRLGDVLCSTTATCTCRSYRQSLLHVFVHFQTIFLPLQELLSVIPLLATLHVPPQLLVMSLHHFINLITASIAIHLSIHHPMSVVTVSRQLSVASRGVEKRLEMKRVVNCKK